MATYRPPLKGKAVVDKTALKQVFNQLVQSQVSKFRQIGINAMREIREGAVNAWYGSTALNTMNIATEYTASKHAKLVNGQYVVTITSYVDIDKYDAEKQRRSEGTYSIYEWVDKHSKAGWSLGEVSYGEPISMEYAPAAYLIHLQWDLGIRGLPERETKTGTGWTNPNPHIEKPMSECVEEAISAKWEETVNKYTKKG